MFKITRANINFIDNIKPNGSIKLFFYWNGDQYPRGIRDFYNVMDFVNSGWSIEDFKKWAKKNYEDVAIELIEQPKIYYTGDFITDYSYIFDNSLGNKQIKVYCWDELVFNGDIKKFDKWIKKQD